MSFQRKFGGRIVVRFALAILWALFLVLALRALGDRPFDRVTAGAVLGAFGVICIAGVYLGVREAREKERLRKARQDIWIKQ